MNLRLTLLQQVIDDRRQQVFRLDISLRNSRKELREAGLKALHEGRRKPPHVHGDEAFRVEHFQPVAQVHRGSVLGLHDIFRLIDADEQFIIIQPADTAGDAAVVRERIFKDETGHEDFLPAGVGLLANKRLMEKLKAFLPVVIVRVHDRERLRDDVPGRQDRLARTPRLRAAFRKRKALREVIQVLKCVRHLDVPAHPVADDAPEVFLDILPDNENHLVKPCLRRIVDRVIHDDLTGRSDRGELLDPAAETAADTRCQHDQRCFLHDS